jgi:hypothetical protein
MNTTGKVRNYYCINNAMVRNISRCKVFSVAYRNFLRITNNLMRSNDILVGLVQSPVSKVR